MKIIRCQDRKGNIVYAAQQPDGSALKLAGGNYYSLKVTSESVDVAKLLAPIEPISIICIVLNYRKHAEETGAKFLQHPGEPILLPTHLKSDEVDYECELAVVIGRTCKNISRDRALDFVLGYTC